MLDNWLQLLKAFCQRRNGIIVRTLQTGRRTEELKFQGSKVWPDSGKTHGAELSKKFIVTRVEMS